MSLRRYAIWFAPVEHLNGKLDKASRKCSYQDGSDENGVAYYYGYRHSGSCTSLYAFRNKCRNLAVKPITPDEAAHTDYFVNCVTHVQAIYSQLDQDSEARKAFKAQRRYRSFWGFCIAITYQNGGVFPYPP